MVLFITNCEFCILLCYLSCRVYLVDSLILPAFISSNSLNSLWEGKSIGYVLLDIIGHYDMSALSHV